MQKINFEDLPSTATPINATNLNAIQENAEDAITDIENTITGIQETITDIQNYSTTETVTGTWINDKPIYRKILTNVTISLTNDAQDIPHGISNFSDLVDLKIKAKYGSTTFDLLSSGYIVRVTGTNINILKMAQGINLGSYVMTIIIEYTKTTN